MNTYDFDSIFPPINDENEDDECSHLDFSVENGEHICSDCGKLIDHISLEKDWRYYGASDNRANSDPARCHQKKDNSASILSILQTKNLSTASCEMAQKWYQGIVEFITKKNKKTAIYRGGNRIAIAAACVYYTKINEGDYMTWEDIMKMFNIKKKKFTRGTKIFTDVYPDYREVCIKPEHLIKKLLRRMEVQDHSDNIESHSNTNNNSTHNNGTHVSSIHTDNIIKLSRELYLKCDVVTNSKPNSVAAAIIYIYFKKVNEDIVKNGFASRVGLSEATITNLVKDITAGVDENKIVF